MTRPNGQSAATVAAPAVETAQPHDLLERVVEATAAHRYSLPEVQFMAKSASLSGMYNMSEAQAFTLMMICEADGLHPIQALRRFHIMKFFSRKDNAERVTATLKAAAIQAEMLRTGWDIEWLTECDDVERQEGFFKHPKKCPKGKPVRFTTEDAIRAELLEGPNKDNWRKYPANMRRARVISNACYMLDPGITQGFYTPEEVSDFDDRPASRASPRPLTPTPLSPAETAEQGGYGTVDNEAKAAPAPPRGECSAWIQNEIDDVENEWASICAKAKVPHHHLGDKGKRLTVWQTINGVVTTWLERDLVEPSLVQTNDGKRDKARVMETIRAEWDAIADGSGFDDDVREYLRGKLEIAAAEAKVNLDAEPAEEVAANA